MTPPDDRSRSPSGWEQPVWTPVVADRPRGRRRRAPRRRGWRPGGGTLLVVALAAGGGWWAWSPENRETAREVLAEVRAGAGLPAEPVRIASDGTRLPPVGLEEAATRLAPVVVPETTSERYAFKPAGDSTVSPVGWSPCRPIHYVVDLTGAPEGFGTTVRAAVAEVATHTGLTFVDDGEVLEAAVEDRDALLPGLYGDRWAPVLIRFADDATVPGLAGDTVGLAGVVAMTSPRTGISHVVSGAVYLDVELLGLPALGGVEPYLPVLRHELGHLVGLDHVDDPTQLMYPATGYVTTFQPGDLTGPSLLGQTSCAPDL